MDDLISKLSEIRSEYNCFEADEEPYYRALSEAIKILSQRADGDTISRQAAIDIERNATVDTNPSHFEAHQKFPQFMDDVEVSSFGRWQWSNGFNTALTAVGIDLKKLPTAQPEILACGEGELNVPDTNVGDMISRQAAIEAIDDIESEVADGFGFQYEKWREYFCELPAVQPDHNFCSKCGADMRGGEME